MKIQGQTIDFKTQSESVNKSKNSKDFRKISFEGSEIKDAKLSASFVDLVKMQPLELLFCVIVEGSKEKNLEEKFLL